jgi:hypothetical protein
VSGRFKNLGPHHGETAETGMHDMLANASCGDEGGGGGGGVVGGGVCRGSGGGVGGEEKKGKSAR